MRRTFYSICLLAAVCSTIFVGCKKDSDVVTLRCSVETSAVKDKGYIDANDYPEFYSTGEKVNVNGNEYSITPESNHSFSIANVTAATDYYAVYPYSITGTSCNSSSVSVKLPYTQTYEVDDDGHQVVDMPMGAVATSTNNVHFYNLCSILELKVLNTSGSAITVTSIEVTAGSDVGLAGEGTATLNGTSSKISISHSLLTQTVRLELPTAITLANNAESAPLQIVLPPFESKPIAIKVRTADGSKSVAKHNSSFTLARNTIYPLTFKIGENEEEEDTGLPGYFSVSATKKVIFSKGNLQAVREQTTDPWTWKFADHQYDFYGENNRASRNSSYNNQVNVYHRDLFIYSNPNTEYGLGINDELEDEGSFVDWGDKHIEGDPEGETPWYTLSADEWIYLIGAQNASATTPTRANAANLRARARIDLGEGYEGHPATGSTGFNGRYIYGFLILPDNWTTPKGITLDPAAQENQYTLAQWERLENAGAMFLPAASYCDTYYQVQQNYKLGYYWTSSAGANNANTDIPQYLTYDYNDDYTHMTWQVTLGSRDEDEPDFRFAMSVRLVKDAPTTTTSSKSKKLD